MPRAKRALSDANLGTETPRTKTTKTKKSDARERAGAPLMTRHRDDPSDEEWESELSDHDIVTESVNEATSSRPENQQEVSITQKDPTEYILMSRPAYDWEAENDALEEEEEQLDEDNLEKVMNEERKRIPHDTPATEMPNHKWVIMRGAWIELCNSCREQSYRCPDNFGMYIYNDWEGYGSMEIIENFLVAFQKEFTKKDQDLKKMWIQISGLAHWMANSRFDALHMIDDGERLAATMSVIGHAFLAMLNALERANYLKPDSEFKDLGIIIGLYMGIAREFDESVEDEWKDRVAEYAEIKNIDISIVAGTKGIELDDDPLEAQKSWPKAAADRWGFQKKFKAHEKSYGTKTLGGRKFDITKMGRKERASYAFDKKDPLKDIPDKALKEGLVRFG